MREHEREQGDGGAGHGTSPRQRRSTRRSSRTREEYAAAFERVRLVRAWIAAAAALVAVLSGYVAVLERVVK